jgi:hypothetical protein
VHRLRDLTRRQQCIALGLVALLLVPFAASVGRAIHQGWLPTGDDALIGLRSVDVFTKHLPLVGQPSTSHLYGDKISTAHPGPIEFYWLAPFVRMFGGPIGMITASALANVASVLVAAWVVFRRVGPAGGAWALVVLGGVLWSEGTAVLTDVISSNAGGIPLLALAVLAWAVADGDLRLLPLAVVFGSWVAQQHLAIVAPAASMVLVAMAGAVGVGVSRLRQRRTGETETTADREADEPEAPAPARLWPWLVGAAGVALVCWLPVLWQQAAGHPGNVSAVLKYAGSSDQEKLGWASGFRQALRSFGFPPLLLRSDLGGADFFGAPLHPLEWVAGIAGFATLVAIAIFQWTRRRALALLAITAMVLALGGAYNGSTIPVGIEAFRVNFYRWAFVVAWLSWIAIGWLAVVGYRWWLGRRGRRLVVPRAAVAFAVIALLVPAVLSVTTAGHDDMRRDQAGFRIMRRAAAAAVREADGHGRVTLVLRGSSSVLASGPAVTMALASHGHSVLASPVEGRFYGRQRVLRRGEDPGGVILELVTGHGSVPDGPGRVVMHGDLNPELNRALRPLVDAARGQPVEVSDRGRALLRRHWDTPGERTYIRSILAKVARDPALVLGDPNLLRVVREGYFTSPALPAAKLAILQRHLPARTVNGDDVFEIRVLTRDELATEVPRWATT